jgi:hypothetical protein
LRGGATMDEESRFPLTGALPTALRD